MKLLIELYLEVDKTKAESILGRRRKREKGERQMDKKVILQKQTEFGV